MEYTTTVDDNGRLKANNVTGPMGAFVQGMPPRRMYQNDDRFGDNDSQGGFGRRN